MEGFFSRQKWPKTAQKRPKTANWKKIFTEVKMFLGQRRLNKVEKRPKTAQKRPKTANCKKIFT
jgi:hypothetical protein